MWDPFKDMIPTMDAVIYIGEYWRFVIGTAVVSEDFQDRAIKFDENDAWAEAIRKNPDGFWFGVCQPKPEAPLELVAYPRRAYPEGDNDT